MTLRWMPIAARDLERISVYLSENAPYAERRVIRELYAGIKSLETMPERGRPAKPEGTRQLVFVDLHYVVTYRILNARVEIVRIRHSARKPLSH